MIDFLKEFIYEATIGNAHIFWHLFGGMVLGKIGWNIAYINKKRFALLFVLFIAILFEAIMLYVDGYMIYGSLQNWIADSFGDILGSVIMTWVVVD